jgi:GAF domain-containing protein
VSEAGSVDLLAAFTRLQALTLTSPRVEQFLSELAAFAPQLGGPAISCSVTIRGEHQEYTVASSDAFANQVDEVQYNHGEGPCLQSLRTGSPVYVHDLRNDPRWPGYRDHAIAAGVRSSLSLPMPVAGTVIGALNVYCTQPDAFDENLRQGLGLFAAQAAAALTMVLRQARQDQTATQLEQALASRTTIDQAMGILMAQQRCTADEAFALLRAHSQNANRKIRDVAADLIHRVTGAPPAPRTPFVTSSPANADGNPDGHTPADF